MDSKDETQLKIFYYFMMADGKITADKMSFFKSICDNLGVSSDIIRRVIHECEEAVDPYADNLVRVLEQRIGRLLEADKNERDGLASNNRLQGRILWNLISLGCVNKQYSKAERQIVKFVGKQWKIQETDIIDMEDTAEAMLSLERKKEWLQSTSKSATEKNEIQVKIETDRKILLESLKITMENIN